MPKYHNTSLALEAKIKLQTASDKWKAVVNRVDHKTTIFLVSVTLRNDRRFGKETAEKSVTGARVKPLQETGGPDPPFRAV